MFLCKLLVLFNLKIIMSLSSFYSSYILFKIQYKKYWNDFYFPFKLFIFVQTWSIKNQIIFIGVIDNNYNILIQAMKFKKILLVYCGSSVNI